MKSDGARKQVSDVWSHCSLVIPHTSPSLLIAPEWVFSHQTYPYPWWPRLCLAFSSCPGKVITTPSTPAGPPAGTESITYVYACSTTSPEGLEAQPLAGRGMVTSVGSPTGASSLVPPVQALRVSWHRGYSLMGHHPLRIWAEGFPRLHWGLGCDPAAHGTVHLAASSQEPGPSDPMLRECFTESQMKITPAQRERERLLSSFQSSFFLLFEQGAAFSFCTNDVVV